MGERNIFILCVSPHLDGGYPIPGLDGVVPHPRCGWGLYLITGLNGGGYPSVPPARTGWGTPWLGLDGWGYPRVPPGQDWDEVTPPVRSGCRGVPHHRSGWGVTCPGLDRVGTPSLVWIWGTPFQV